ncbi:MAG: DUF2784 domain-containing protein [Candidatus Binatia bacterium]
MLFRLLADAVLSLHLAFVVYAVLGALLVLRWRWTMWLHVPAAGWAVLVEIAGWPCPLTPLESWLRESGGGEPYATGFVESVIAPVLYPAALTREVQILLGVAVGAINAGIYGWIFASRPAPRRGD